MTAEMCWQSMRLLLTDVQDGAQLLHIRVVVVLQEWNHFDVMLFCDRLAGPYVLPWALQNVEPDSCSGNV